MTTTDFSVEQHDAPRPYPRLTEAQKDCILADLLTEYRLNNLRPIEVSERVTQHEASD